jgi:hypothetical protein
MRRTRGRHRIAVGIGVAAIALGVVAPASAEPVVETVEDGFITPLGLAVGENDTIYVAEAFAGQLSSIDRQGNRSTIVEGAGLALPGVDARGNDVAFTLTEFPESEAVAPDTTLQRLLPSGRRTQTASLGAFEQAANPDAVNEYGFRDLPDDCAAEFEGVEFPPSERYPGEVFSNPYSVAIDGADRVVADAGANSIVRVRANGRVSALAVLPPIEQTITPDAAAFMGLPDCAVGLVYDGEPVPTDVEVGPDGHYYVSALPGFPEEEGAGAVFRVHRSTGDVSLVADGLTYATDLAVANDGTIYVTELVVDFEDDSQGRISRIRGGEVSTVVELGNPTAIEIVRQGRRETIYATVDAFENGRVVTVTP